MTYRNKVDGSDTIVLQKGHVDPGKPTLVRMHALSIFDDMFGRARPAQAHAAARDGEIGEDGAGRDRDADRPSADAPRYQLAAAADAAPDMDLRDYGVGAQILADLGVHDMILLTNTHRNRWSALEGYGLSIVGERPIPEE